MDLKDIFIILLIICIFGIVIFGSVGSFVGHVSDVVDHFSGSAESSQKQFTVDYLEGKSSDSHVITEGNEISNSGDYSVVDGSDSSKSSGQNGAINNKTENSSSGKYKDYQVDYETDMVDSQGNPIIFSIVSTSGKQMDPGIYEVYWSKLGIINHTRIS